MTKFAFERYAPFIQEYIYRKKWTSLREVQVEACEAILDTNKHVIIASGTASGKTEAAFFPILTSLENNPSKSIGVMYIGPLKALINDQFERLNELLDEHGIPVWPWHGDISQNIKRKALKTAQGVLQITPESLEALLLRHPGDANKLFSDLRFIVIDEIHSLMGEDRGLQVQCLISRLEKLTGCRPRRIGLSATLNDYRPAITFLTAGSPLDAVAVGLQSHKRTISLCVENFILPDNAEQRGVVQAKYNEFIYDNCHTKKCLIFTNNRGNAEKIIADMKTIAQRRNDKDIFYVHHGSVSAALRQEAEHALRDNNTPAVASATLTLELGIDIGDLDTIIQLGAPYTAASFVQRLGRSGRRSEKSQMMFLCSQFEKHNEPIDELPWDLLRAIAIIQLYIEERWVEPFEQKKKPFSLLAHQTLSALMSRGELSHQELAQTVLSLPPFQNKISLDEYRELLRFMLCNEYIQRLDDGNIIVGLNGEKTTNHYSFYSVFQTEEVYCVKSATEEVGTLTSCPAVDEVFILAGRSWIVVSVDEDRKIIYVKQNKNNRIPYWLGPSGDVHKKIVLKMKEVLLEADIYSYLRPNAAKALERARMYAREFGLLERDIIPSNDGCLWILPWTGSKEIRSLSRLFSYGLQKQLSVLSVEDHVYYIKVKSELQVDDFLNQLKTINLDMTNPHIALSKNEKLEIDKYDYMVPEELLQSAFLLNRLDIPAACETVKTIT